MSKNQYLVIGLAAVGIVGSMSAPSLLNSSSVLSQTNHINHQGTGIPLTSSTPTLPGQDAFGAMQEIVRILEADPATEWSRVNLGALREHLIDMNEVTLNAVVKEQEIDGGLEIQVTGTGRTQAAIRRLVPNQVKELNQLNDWQATSASLPEGVMLTVTSKAVSQSEHIRALGFFGLLVSGSYHQGHHLALARGIVMH